MASSCCAQRVFEPCGFPPPLRVGNVLPVSNFDFSVCVNAGLVAALASCPELRRVMPAPRPFSIFEPRSASRESRKHSAAAAAKSNAASAAEGRFTTPHTKSQKPLMPPYHLLSFLVPHPYSANSLVSHISTMFLLNIRIFSFMVGGRRKVPFRVTPSHCVADSPVPQFLPVAGHRPPATVPRHTSALPGV